MAARLPCTLLLVLLLTLSFTECLCVSLSALLECQKWLSQAFRYCYVLNSSIVFVLVWSCGRRCYNLWGVVIAECNNKCEFRCSATSHKKPCLFFCKKCCATCLCVPPGTYGNKEACPCYNNWKTKEGGPKCP
ncbi:hypothetical protein C4D60_Mb09t23430 [Musa balbisiana]|uniref:Uncharacterized protein n=1 Tax=Musa balbisiana TaxID=52838 RepID=A0A4S8IIL1_MUSBA|nr:hypothetical protein C4D60_Mb09t23430 [Musa balbisiana]